MSPPEPMTAQNLPLQSLVNKKWNIIMMHCMDVMQLLIITPGRFFGEQRLRVHEIWWWNQFLTITKSNYVPLSTHKSPSRLMCNVVPHLRVTIQTKTCTGGSESEKCHTYKSPNPPFLSCHR